MTIRNQLNRPFAWLENVSYIIISILNEFKAETLNFVFVYQFKSNSYFNNWKQDFQHIGFADKVKQIWVTWLNWNRNQCLRYMWMWDSSTNIYMLSYTLIIDFGQGRASPIVASHSKTDTKATKPTSLSYRR